MKIEIYGKTNCSFCTSAKALLDLKAVQYDYQDFFELSQDDQDQILKVRAPSASTFPIIFIDDVYIGGFSNLNSVFN